MTYYEVYCNKNGNYEIWKWANNGASGERFKVFKTRAGAENWAKRQWCKVIWR